MLRGEYALFERYSTKNCYHHHAQNSKYSSPHFSGNERQAEIDLWQVQRGMVVQLQEEGLPLCWQCEFCQYFANIKSIIKVIPVIQVAKYNKLYLCGSSMPSDFKLTSKVTWIIQNTKFLLNNISRQKLWFWSSNQTSLWPNPDSKPQSQVWRATTLPRWYFDFTVVEISHFLPQLLGKEHNQRKKDFLDDVSRTRQIYLL